MRRLVAFVLFFIVFFGVKSYGINSTYCAEPPFIQSVMPVNIMLVLDYSGSMGWAAYANDYSSNKTYYGYFRYNKMYKCSNWSWNWSDGGWVCDGYWYVNNSGEYSGDYLNWVYMTRIDILRWILTGGKVSQDVVITESGVKIKKEDVSSYNPSTGNVEGILQKIGRMEQKPRIGALIFQTQKHRPWSIQFTRIGLSQDYEDLIYAINTNSVGGNTPTGPAMQDIQKYFEEDETTISEYDNINPYDFNGHIAYCAKNFTILMSDGEWNTPTITTSSDPIRPIDSMWKGGNADLVAGLKGKQNVRTYSVAMFQSLNSYGTNALKWMAVYGNYNDLNSDGHPCNRGSYPNTSLTVTENLENQSQCNEVQKNKDGNGPYGFFSGSNPAELKTAIMSVFNEILKQASSGTAASVVSASDKSGANVLQALFWPKRYFNEGSVIWSGTLYNLWMYVGPFSSSQEIRENSDTTGESSSVKNLTLLDKVIQFYSDLGETKVRICDDDNGNGQLTHCVSGESISDIKTIWNAGMQLWRTSPDDRKIFTDVNGLSDNSTAGNFVPANASHLMNYLDVDNLTEAEDIIKWTRGEDITGYRSRTVKIGTETHVWKLGDIIYSTPKVLSVYPVDSYYKKYNDLTYYNFNYNRDGSFKHSNRGMVFVGANDGMLHAFRLGALSFPGGDILAQLRENGGPFGSEAWAFIPKNILPYLKYIAQKDYCHIYGVDLTPYIFDASIGDPNSDSDYGSPNDSKAELSWRTILVGGLNLGGACGDNVTGVIRPPNDTGNVPQGIGLSSYFALDVTNPENPKVLWEFSDNDLGFTTTGPVVIHIPAKKRLDNGTYVDDTSKNGYWYVAFASGPDNYNGTVHKPLYLYVLDLKTGALERKIQLSGSGKLLGDVDAFAGRMFDSSVDLGTNYSDDGFYFGYTYESGDSWKGGVIRVNTLDDPDVNDWQVSLLIRNIGPVTAAVRDLEDTKNKKLWLYFGEGRYFTRDDDPTAQRRIYGVEDPCYSNGKLIDGCSATLTLSDLDNVTNNSNATLKGYEGWYIDLNPYGTVVDNTTYNAERLISDPVALKNGWVFYATFMPTSDICSYGGGTYLWVVNYNNGGTVKKPYGKVFLQTSIGRLNEISLSNTHLNQRRFGKGARNNPLPIPLEGEGGGVGIIIFPPKPLNKTIQWLEE